MLRSAARLTLVALTAWPLAAHGQTATPGDSGDDIVITRPRARSCRPGTPAYGTTVIDRDRLTNDASGRVEDVLSDVAGFQQFRRVRQPLGQSVGAGRDVARARRQCVEPDAGAARRRADRRSVLRLYPVQRAVARPARRRPRDARRRRRGAFGAGAVAGTIELVSADRARPAAGRGRGVLRQPQCGRACRRACRRRLGGGFASVVGQVRARRRLLDHARRPARRGDGAARAIATGRRACARWCRSTRETELQARGLLFGDYRTLRFAGADQQFARRGCQRPPDPSRGAGRSTRSPMSRRAISPTR